MTFAEYDKLSKTGKAPLLMDVRSHPEFRSGHIPGAIHAPMTSLFKSVSSACSDKSTPLALVCEHGPRAQVAAMMLKWKGYKSVVLLDGHMALWKKSGKILQK